MQQRLFKKMTIFACLLLLAVSSLFLLAKGGANGPQSAKAASPIQHYLYVFPDQSLDVYDMDNNFQLVQQISLPMTNGGRGIIADPAHGYLYLSYGGDGGIHGLGSLLKYDPIHNQVVWTKNYTLASIVAPSRLMARPSICLMARRPMMAPGTSSMPAMAVWQAQSSQ